MCAMHNRHEVPGVIGEGGQDQTGWRVCGGEREGSETEKVGKSEC